MAHPVSERHLDRPARHRAVGRHGIAVRLHECEHRHQVISPVRGDEAKLRCDAGWRLDVVGVEVSLGGIGAAGGVGARHRLEGRLHRARCRRRAAQNRLAHAHFLGANRHARRQRRFHLHVFGFAERGGVIRLQQNRGLTAGVDLHRNGAASSAAAADESRGGHEHAPHGDEVDPRARRRVGEVQRRAVETGDVRGD